MKVNPTIAVLGLLWSSPGSIQAAVCDVDNDGDVDRLDLEMIVSARNKPSAGAGDSRDADTDGAITTFDVRACIRQCGLAGCEIIDPAPPARGNNPDRQDTANAGTSKNAAAVSANPTATVSARLGTEIQGGTPLNRGKWTVKRGDTLYSIGRAVFPGDTARQARFRQDVMMLNPSVFADGAHNMAVGAELELPDYIGAEDTPAGSQPAAQVSPVVPNGFTPAPAPRPADAGPPVEPATETPRALPPSPLPATASEPGMQITAQPAASARQSTRVSTDTQASASLSLGYSQGGDRLGDTGDARDLHAGSGAHMRLGFEQVFRHGGGYRLALGLQYNLLRDSDENSNFRDAYLQLAYQRRSDAIVYGVGAVLHTGPTLKGDSTRDYEPAAGAVAYLENAGNGFLSGWGISYTSLEIEAQNTAEPIDASRAELYYSWRF